MEIKNVAIVGPRGNIGSAIIDKLLLKDSFTTTALIRPTSTYIAPINASSIKVISVDFGNQSSLLEGLKGQDAVLCCVPGGATKFAAQKLLIDAAIEAGVKLFFASEFASNIMSPHYQIFPTEFVGDKVKVREYLEEKAKTGELAWTALNGGPFLDLWLSWGVAGFDIPNRQATIYGTGNNLSCWTSISVIATAAVNMLLNPNPILNRSVSISGVRNLTQNTILAALEAETRDKFAVKYVDVEKIKADAFEALEKGDSKMATRGLTINSNFNEEDSAANFWHTVENELVGVKAVDVSEAVRTYLNEKRVA